MAGGKVRTGRPARTRLCRGAAQGRSDEAVACTEKGYAAFQDRCTHRGGPLSDGVLICGTVQCPWHGSQFDVHTGAVKCGPAEEEIAVYPMENAHRIDRQ